MALFTDTAIRLLPAAATFATGTLTLTGQPSDTETFVVGATTYTMNTALTDTANNILIGASATATCNNIVAAINAAAGAGTAYGTGTTANAGASAVRASDTVVFTAKAAYEGPLGATIVTTDTLTNASFGAATLTGAGSTTVAAPSSVTLATLGMPIPFCCNQATVLVRSVLGSGTMTASPVLWGFSPTQLRWYMIGALNAGTAVPETSKADTIAYCELVTGLRRFSKLYCELSVSGTAVEIEVVADCIRAQPVST